MPNVTRRQALTGLAATGVALVRSPALADIASALERYPLGDLSSIALWDVGARQALDEHDAARALPPASVLKIMTALYARAALGPGYRLETELRALGPIEDGTLQGGCALIGGGDPTLDANALKSMAEAFAEAGVRAVNGPFLLFDAALPAITEIEARQPAHVSYNPTVSGLNLNFNRVRIEWAPEEGGPGVEFFAPGQNFRVPLEGIGGEWGSAPPPKHRLEDGREIWALPRDRLTGRGALWLPVRQPARHAGEVFRALCGEVGIALAPPEISPTAPDGTALVVHESGELDAILTGMLRYSTNLTAEIVGLRASQARGVAPSSLAESAAAMTDWAHEKYGLTDAQFVDHSGLSDRSRWSAAETIRVLLAESDGSLPDLLRDQPIVTEDGRRMAEISAQAKTGTLYFASGLAGYMQTPRRRLAFAIYSADLARRATIPDRAPDAPRGARSWSNRARALQRDLLRNWAQTRLPPAPLRPLPRPG